MSMKKLLGTATAMALILSPLAYSGHHESAEKASQEQAAGAPDIVEAAAAAGTFTTLVAAVEAAGLVETLKGKGPFTVFAPTDEAFAALPEGTLESLLEPESREKLATILTYHVVPGKVMSSDIAGKEMMVETVQGGELKVDATSGVKVNNATVVKADIETSNGVIHVIDAVIMPAN